MATRRQYTHSLEAAIESQIPDSILDALAAKGWNAFGIFELVMRELANEGGGEIEAIKFAQEAIRDNLKAYHYKNEGLLLEAFNRLGEYTGEKIDTDTE